jgi:hypothetical protein
MKKTSLIAIIFLLLFSHLASAVATLGGEISYRYLGSNKYELQFKVYRDCRGLPFSAPDFSLACGSSGGSAKSLTATRVSIKDISPTCKTYGVLCNPANSTISSSNFAVEEHRYLDTIDFSGSEASFASCGTVSIGMGQGSFYRSSSITTGAAGNTFWVTATLELAQTKTNTSPVFNKTPQMIHAPNQAIKLDCSATDSVEGDSLSYALINPKTSWTTVSNWSSTYSTLNPFTPFYPSGYNISKGPKPDANPPIGIFLDPITGLFSATPTSGTEISQIVYAVNEWRKDASGKYQQIGQITRDVILIFAGNSSNVSPSIPTSETYTICEGEKFSLDIYTSDKPFFQPPPNSSILNDTVKISWQMNIKGASIKRDSAYIKQQAAKFEWTPQTSDVRTKPYIFSVTGTDNACPYLVSSTKMISLTVRPKIKVNSKITKINNSNYAHELSIGNKSYSYFIANSVKTSHPYDDRSFYFKSTKRLDSDKEKDTIIFKKNGIFILNQSFISSINCNSTTISDTIKVTGVTEVFVTQKLDTSVCKNLQVQFKAKTQNAVRPVTYTWKLKSTTITDTLGVLNRAFNSNDSIYLSIKDSAGNTNSTYFYVNILALPQITAGPDKTACTGISEILVAKSLKADTLTWQWSMQGNIVSKKDSVLLTQAGLYILKASNAKGCSLTDTIEFKNFVKRQVKLKSGVYCQSKNELNQSEIFETNSNPNSFKQLQWNLQRTIIKPDANNNTLADLLQDLDVTPKYNYRIKFNKFQVNISNYHRDSLRFGLQAWDSNGCISSSSMTLTIIRMPLIEFGFKTHSMCQNDSVDLKTKVLTEGVSKWLAVNTVGYNKWPQTGEIANGQIQANILNRTGGKYNARITSTLEFCSSSDSMDILINPVPLPKIDKIEIGDSIKFTDNSLNSTNRTWYLDNINRGKAKTIGFRKLEGVGKDLKIVLSNSNCDFDTMFMVTYLDIAKLEQAAIKIYPNPANHTLTIQQFKSLPNTTYTIYNAYGQFVKSGNLDGMETKIDVDTLSFGLYILRIADSESNFSYTFLKQAE